MIAQDESIYEVVKSINASIENVCVQSKAVLDAFHAFNFLWTSDIHDIFEDFLKGLVAISRGNTPRPPSKNFMSNKTTATK
jgi:hypothetical protein